MVIQKLRIINLKLGGGDAYFKLNTWEADTGRSLPGLQIKFQDIQGYTEKPCLEK